jgi:hypothetical protein
VIQKLSTDYLILRFGTISGFERDDYMVSSTFSSILNLLSLGLGLDELLSFFILRNCFFIIWSWNLQSLGRSTVGNSSQATHWLENLSSSQ